MNKNRKQFRFQAEPMTTLSVRLPKVLEKGAEKIGDGNKGEGVRIALQIVIANSYLLEKRK